MTGPVGDGGRTFQVAQAAVLLTEYARQSDSDEVLVINLGNVRVWLAGNSSVAPANGVPLDPGTALPWSTSGQVWAVADPAATSAVPVLITSASNSWTPSPAAIALQVAQQLLETGIPNVYTESTVYDGTVPGSGTPSVTLDVSGFASIVVIEAGSGGPRDSGVQVDWLSTDPAITDVICSDFVHGTMRLPCVSGKVKITNLLGATQAITLKVLGTNRPTPRTRESNNEKIDHWSLSNNPWVASATPVDFNEDDSTVNLQGDCYLYILVTGSQALKGRFIIRQLFGNRVFQPQTDVPFASLDEAINGGATTQSLTKKITVPAVPWSIGFICSTGTAGNAVVDVYLTQEQV